MDTDLDDLLTASAPPVAARTDELTSIVASMLVDAEVALSLRRPRLGRRAGIAGLAAAGVLGLGVAASAAGLVQPPWSNSASTPFTYPGPFIHADVLSNGTDCKVVFGASESEDPKHPVGKEERHRALAFAKDFVLHFDLSIISVPEAIEKYKADYAKMVIASGPPDPDLPSSQLVPEGPPDEIRMAAILSEIDRRLRVELKSHGMSTHAVSAFGGAECRHDSRPSSDDFPSFLVE